MFLSGIIIPMQSLGLLSEYNYIATFVEAGRSILIASLDFSLTIIEMPIIFIMSVIVFLIGVYVFHSSVKVVLGN